MSGPVTLSREALWEAISQVLDPEVPALTVVDLGIVRDVRITDDAVEVDITPTYSGCPAMKLIEEEIIGALKGLGVENVRVRTVFQPAWTTGVLNPNPGIEGTTTWNASSARPPCASGSVSGPIMSRNSANEPG